MELASNIKEMKKLRLELNQPAEISSNIEQQVVGKVKKYFEEQVKNNQTETSRNSEQMWFDLIDTLMRIKRN